MRDKLRIEAEVVDVSVVNGENGSAEVVIGEAAYSVQQLERTAGELTFRLNGRKFRFSVLNRQGTVEVTDGTAVYIFQRVEPGLEGTEEQGGDELNSQMPGTVLKLMCNPGDAVERGKPLLILEAMKMEHEVCAPADGKVESYPFAEGDRVMPGDLLVEFTATETESD